MSLAKKINSNLKREWYKQGFESYDLANPFSKSDGIDLLAWSFFNAGVLDRVAGHEYDDKGIR